MECLRTRKQIRVKPLISAPPLLSPQDACRVCVCGRRAGVQDACRVCVEGGGGGGVQDSQLIFNVIIIHEINDKIALVII